MKNYQKQQDPIPFYFIGLQLEHQYLQSVNVRLQKYIENLDDPLGLDGAEINADLEMDKEKLQATNKQLSQVLAQQTKRIEKLKGQLDNLYEACTLAAQAVVLFDSGQLKSSYESIEYVKRCKDNFHISDILELINPQEQ